MSFPSGVGSNVPELKLPAWRANFWFAVLWLIMLIDAMDRQCVTAIFPALKSAFQLTDAQLGLVGSITGLTISILVFPVAIIVDKWSRRKMVAIMVAVWSIATFATGLAKGFYSLLAARLAVGVGEAGYGAAGFSLISAYYPQKKRGLMIGLFQAAAILGVSGGVGLGGFIAFQYGWKSVFGILAIPGLGLAILAWFLPDFKTKRIEANHEREVKPRIKEVLDYIFKTPTLLMVYLGAVSIYVAFSTFAMWTPTFFGRTFALDIKEAGKITALVTLLSWPGSPLGGWLGDRFLKRTKKGRLWAAGIGVGLFLIFISLALQMQSFRYVVALWTIAVFFLISYTSNLIAVTQDLVPPYFRSISYSFIPLFQQILAGVWAPMITGFISDRYGLNYALQVIAVFSTLLSLFFFIVASRFYKQDLEKVTSLGKFELGQK
jgi:MFS family permease